MYFFAYIFTVLCHYCIYANCITVTSVPKSDSEMAQIFNGYFMTSCEVNDCQSISFDLMNQGNLSSKFWNYFEYVKKWGQNWMCGKHERLNQRLSWMSAIRWNERELLATLTKSNFWIFLEINPFRIAVCCSWNQKVKT